MSKHTPGPWRVEELVYKSSSFYIRGSGKDGSRLTFGKGCVAHIPRSTVSPSRENANLIAAAPDLLEALQAEQEWRERDEAGALDPEWDYEVMVGAKRRAAIAKATGEQQC